VPTIFAEATVVEMVAATALTAKKT
jgi:hypothetical protein